MSSVPAVVIDTMAGVEVPTTTFTLPFRPRPAADGQAMFELPLRPATHSQSTTKVTIEPTTEATRPIEVTQPTEATRLMKAIRQVEAILHVETAQPIELIQPMEATHLSNPNDIAIPFTDPYTHLIPLFHNTHTHANAHHLPTFLHHATASRATLTTQHARALASQRLYILSAAKTLRSAQNQHYQNRADMDASIATHMAAINALTTQLTIMKAQHARQHTALDVLDANALAVLLDAPVRRGNGDMNMTMHTNHTGPSTAKLTRTATRAANKALQATLTAQISAHHAGIAAATQRFEHLFLLGAERASRIALRELASLKRGGAKVPKGERGMAFWNGVRRAAGKGLVGGGGGKEDGKGGDGGDDDVHMLEEYRRELAEVIVDAGVVVGGVDAVQRYGARVAEERDGMFSMSGWTLGPEL